MSKYSSSYQKMFKAALAATLATGAIVTVAPAVMQADSEVSKFNDIGKSQAFYDEVLNLSSRGIINGFTDNTFRPYESVTRGQAAKILALTLDLDIKNVKNPGFTDVRVTDDFYGPIAALVNAGIIDGYSDKTYRQSEKLTRAQMAKLISLGFDFNSEAFTDTRFKDVNAKNALSGYIQTLITHKITLGTSPTTFAPDSFVTRGQMALFVVRSEAAAQVKAKVVNISADSIELSTGTYQLSADLKKLFNTSNLSALKGSIIGYTIENDVVVKVGSIEINENGNATNNIVLDGNGYTFAGNIAVNGDYVTLKNLTIKGNLEIGKEVENRFNADNITVEGKTIISDKTRTANNAVKTAAVVTGPELVFLNSTIGSVEVSQSGGVTLSLKGNGTVGSVTISSSIILEADEGITIQTVTVSAGATNVEINGDVNNLVVNSPNVQLTIGADVIIGNIVLPAGKTVEEIIQNYDEVKENIGEIDGETNPDATPAPGGGGGIPSTPPVGNAILHQLLSDNYKIGNGNESGAVDINLVGNTFNVLIDNNGTTFGDFETDIEGIFNSLDEEQISITKVTWSYVASNGLVLESSVSNINTSLEFTSALTKVLDKLGIDKTDSLSILENKSVNFKVEGSINGDVFNDTYTFDFEIFYAG